MELGKDQLERIVDALCDRLDGDWLLLGGALVALEFDARRATEDVDVVGLLGTADERYRLLDLAAALGLPVETINSAADYFVRKIPDWRKRLLLFRDGERGRVFRPDATLFVQLKLRRLTPTDLADCEAVLARESIDHAVIAQDLAALPATTDQALRERRERLRALV